MEEVYHLAILDGFAPYLEALDEQLGDRRTHQAWVWLSRSYRDLFEWLENNGYLTHDEAS